MRKLTIAAVFGLLLAAVLIGRPAANAQGRPASGEDQKRHQPWDYTVIRVLGNIIAVDGKEVQADFLTVLRRLGNDGWELTASTRGVAMEKEVQYIFKRPRN